MKVGFFREDEGSAMDQPRLNEWVAGLRHREFFAAILGDPVEHSWTPAEQRDFFAAFAMPVVRIPLSLTEANDASLAILRRLGLVAAAVTSPLKDAFGHGRSVNTLAWDFRENRWQTQNTDRVGLVAALKDLKTDLQNSRTWVVWGGGGTLEILREHLRDAAFYSARTGQPREGSHRVDQPQAVLWAAGAMATVAPPKEWQPELVLDLSYTEDSAGRGYALQTGARYVSGVQFFRAQAEAQRKFWEPFLEFQPRTVANDDGIK
jgi:shikimate 5-dehydrogenase